MFRITSPLITAVATFVALVGEQIPVPQRGITENDGLALATLDSREINDSDAIFQRYVWIEEADLENFQALSFVVNLFGDGALPYKPMLLGRDKLMVARIDLRNYRVRNPNDIIQTWEELQFDPRFSLLITEDTIRFLSIPNFTVKKTIKTKEMVKVPPFKSAIDGKTYEWREEVSTRIVEVPFKDAKIQLARQTSEHIDQAAFGELATRLQTQAPIVSLRYLIYRGTSTIQEDGVFKIIFGGLYYELAGIPQSKDPKVSDLDLLFEQLGIGNVKAGVTAEKIFDSLRSDQRIAIFRSLVTGKPRMAEVLPTLLGRDGKPIVGITHDIKDKNVDIGSDPIMNLQKFQDDARELIFSKANELQGYAAYDGKGKLQREVPFDVANDTTIPHPHTQRLQPGIGCIRCHGKEGGWMVLTNDVKKLLSYFPDVFGDNAVQRNNRTESVERIVGLYSGNLERIVLPRARDDYAAAMLRATGPWARSKQNNTDIVSLASEKVSEIYNGYWYNAVDAKQALKELGFSDVKDADAVAVLRSLVPPVPVIINGVIPEDPRIAALLAGLSINRYQFDMVYSFLATRVKKGVKLP